MLRRRFEQVAVMLLSIIMLVTSTGIVSSLASNVNESSAAPEISSTSASTSTTVTEEGGSVTSSTVAQEGGAVIPTNTGDGTQENPYLISTLAEFLAISGKVNNTASGNKYFALANDIDLSAVTEKDFLDNGGSLIGIDKSLSEKSENVFIVFDGNGYSLKGLNVTFEKSTAASIFGWLNAKSVVKNVVIEEPVFRSTSDSMTAIAFVSVQNKGTISGVKITYPVLSAAVSQNTAFITAENLGTVTDAFVRGTHTNLSASTSDNHTISATGTVGAVAGVNHGTVSNVSAINIGMFIPETEEIVVYGGVVGCNSGAVLNSVSTGNAKGGKSTDSAGGIVGKAIAPAGAEDVTSTLTNNYTLVSLSSSAWGCSVIGTDGKAEMMTDCFWSGVVSGKDTMSTDYGTGVNELIKREFIIIPEGKTAVISADDYASSVWGKASFELDGEIALKGEGFTAKADAGSMSFTANESGKVAYATAYNKITLPANVGSTLAGNTLKQYIRVALLAVDKDAQGNGSAENPFVIRTAKDYSLIKYAPTMNVVLGNDVSFSTTVPAIKGTFDGNGYAVNTAKALASNVYGTLKNVSVNVVSDISTAVFGNAVNAMVDGVSVTLPEGVVFDAGASCRGILFNRISGQSVINDTRVQGDITITADAESIGAFAGLINGDRTVITNSGAVADIATAENVTAKDVALFAGKIDADEVRISDSYIGGANLADKNAFVAQLSGEKIEIKNILTAVSDAEGTASVLPEAYKNEFSKWSFDEGAAGFFTGNGGKFALTIPAIKAFTQSADDYSVVCDPATLIATLTVEGGKVILNVQRAQGVVTVKDVPVTVINKNTGLSATVNVSNGLEKDAEGRYIITTAYDLAYVSENIADLYSADFIMHNDVDMSVLSGFAPIGTTEIGFTGTFDGNGKVIRNLAIEGTAKVGLFGVLNGATVKNITFAGADISAAGGYAGVLAGQVTGKSTISSIAVDGAKVTSSDLYASGLVGSVDGDVIVSDVKITNTQIASESSYIGAVAGKVNAKATLKNITVDGFAASGANYISGVAGLVQGEVNITNANVNNAQLSGVSEISGIASGNGTVSIKDSSVKNSSVSTLAYSSANTAGGVAAVFTGSVENVTVENTKISSGVAGGVVGKTLADCELVIRNVNVLASQVSSSDANTVAAGILGVHNVKGTATVESAYVDAQTVISSGAVTAGLVGDCSGAQSILTITSSKTLAAINGAETANAVASAGALGRIGVSAINNITLASLKVGGSINGTKAVGGVIGLIKDSEAFVSAEALVSDCIVFAEYGSENAAQIIGEIEGETVLNAQNIGSAVKGVILSGFGCVKAYPTDAFVGGYTDIDAGINASLQTLSTREETVVEISGLPQVDGFSFDTSAGWVSESDERISVIASTENSVTLKAERRADISIIGYYVLDADSDVRIPVDFRMVSAVNDPLEGKGTASLPYLIRTAYDLETMVQYADDDAYFALAEDIVLTDADYEFGGAFYNLGNGLVTIGNAQVAFNGNFTGLYNGTVHSITGLRMNGNTLGGLFGTTDGAVITDLIINDADVKASTNAGVLVGRATDTVIKNITINSAKVEATEFGGAAGGVAGVARSTNFENIAINSADIITNLDATKATVEVAGGVAGITDGLVKNVTLTDVSVTAGTFAGGVAGSVRDDALNVINVTVDADVNADYAGGVVGQAYKPSALYVNEAVVMGTVSGTVSAGVVAQLTAEDEANAFDKLTRPMVKDTVVTAKLSGDSMSAIVVGEASDVIVVDAENITADAFSGVYYSSYQNDLGAFGSQQFNAYQNSEYALVDMSDISYSVNGETYDSVDLDTEFTVLGDDSIVMNGVEGSFRSFTAGSRAYKLDNITSDVAGLIVYDAENSAVKLSTSDTGEAKLVFEYNDGLEIAIDISSDYALAGAGTQENPYRISSADDFGFMLNNSQSSAYYVLTNDISLAGFVGGADFSGNLNGNGYVLYDYTGVSLFGRLTGSVSGVGFVGFDVSDAESDSVGAVAAVIDGGQVKDCFVIAEVNANGKNQDAGLLAGRLINGAVVESCLTSGKVVGKDALATGGVVATAIRSTITDTTSTAYVLGGKSSGGIVGETSFATVEGVTFGNMVESDGKVGNIIGNAGDETVITNARFDYRTARTDAAVGSGEYDSSSVRALATEEFGDSGRYPVAKSLADGSAKFKAGVEFASMQIKYISGLSAGSVYNYTDIITQQTVGANSVTLEKTNGLTVTLEATADYAGCVNSISRYANPMSAQAVNLSFSIVDATDMQLSDKLIGVMLKSKVGESANALDFFATVNAQPKSISAAVLNDGKLYVNMNLPEGYAFGIVAVDENGNSLATQDARNEGILVSADGAKSVTITATVSESEAEWGFRDIWSAIGK
jgi:hypothetical protein